jgi:hypothetical protein
MRQAVDYDSPEKASFWLQRRIKLYLPYLTSTAGARAIPTRYRTSRMKKIRTTFSIRPCPRHMLLTGFTSLSV